MNKKNDNEYLANYKEIEDTFNKFIDKQGAIPAPIADYFDLLKCVNTSLNKRIKELDTERELNKDNYQKNNEVVDYVIDTYQAVVQPYLSRIKINNKKDESTIKKLNSIIDKTKQARKKAGGYTPNKGDEQVILSEIKLYKESLSSFNKMTLDGLAKNIEISTGKRISPDTVKSLWWPNYRASKGKTIFQQ